jgi:large subunit ribosomal protein L9
MKVMLLKDVYNLGRAGEVKRVADGYARNFLIPQKLAVPATVGALRQTEKIQAAAAKQRELLNEEMSGIAEQIKALELVFKAKVGETGKLYGSITQQSIIDAVNEKLHCNLDRHQIESQPLREEGEHMVRIRLTFDLIPEVKVIVESDEEKKEEKPAGRKGGKKQAEKAEPEAEVSDVSAEAESTAEVAAEAPVEVAETAEPEEPETPAEEEA